MLILSGASRRAGGPGPGHRESEKQSSQNERGREDLKNTTERRQTTATGTTRREGGKAKVRFPLIYFKVFCLG